MEDADGIASSIGPVRLSANSQGSRIHLFIMELLLWFPYMLWVSLLLLPWLLALCSWTRNAPLLIWSSLIFHTFYSRIVFYFSPTLCFGSVQFFWKGAMTRLSCNFSTVSGCNPTQYNIYITNGYNVMMAMMSNRRHGSPLEKFCKQQYCRPERLGSSHCVLDGGGVAATAAAAVDEEAKRVVQFNPSTDTFHSSISASFSSG